MKSVDIFSDLKLRLSYGENGNIPPADYGSLALIGVSNYVPVQHQ